MTTALGTRETMCHPGRTMVRLLAIAAAALALAGCGDERSAVEREEFIAELEIPLSFDLEEPDVYGQVGMSPNGRNGTRLVIRLDEPFKSPMEAYIRRGGCGGWGAGEPDYDLGNVEDGQLDTEVDVPTRDLRETVHALVVREPLTDEQREARRDRVRGNFFERGVCGDLSSADRVDEY
jgi:hypothetical protein